jgi:uncharacterized protein YgbK (DUF1537 family)
MSMSLSDISTQLPIEDAFDYRSLNQSLFKQLNRTCVVIDDDPTGNQTVYGIPLLTQWDLETILEEFENETPVFYLLTNSRSLSKAESSEIFQNISETIIKASAITGREYTMISRSDSTLRGHFSEIEAIKKGGDFQNAITIFIPVMFEGGRVTINDTHYISEKETLIPVNKTPFSQDHTFSYSNADLKDYIEEKTCGKIKASDVFSLSLEDIRTLDAETLSVKINALESGRFAIVNALNYKDLDKISHALLLAEKLGKQIVYRTSSSFVPSYIGLEPKALLTSEMLVDENEVKGGLTIVGSYVPKSSAQLKYALEHFEKESIIEINVENVLGKEAEIYLNTVAKQMDKQLFDGHDVIVYTSRKLVTGNNAHANINIAASVSNALVAIVRQIKIRPKYLLAKGGITSHDLAIKGLGMKRSKVIGQIEAGIPVWEMGNETKFPKLGYIVFPGNVGNEKSLLTIIQKLS